MLKIDAETGVLVSHTSAPRKRMFDDLETAAKAMREHGERTESMFRQSVDAEKNKEDLFDKKFAEALRKAKDAPEGKPLREFDLDCDRPGGWPTRTIAVWSIFSSPHLYWTHLNTKGRSHERSDFSGPGEP